MEHNSCALLLGTRDGSSSKCHVQLLPRLGQPARVCWVTARMSPGTDLRLGADFPVLFLLGPELSWQLPMKIL